MLIRQAEEGLSDSDAEQDAALETGIMQPVYPDGEKHLMAGMCPRGTMHNPIPGKRCSFSGNRRTSSKSSFKM